MPDSVALSHNALLRSFARDRRASLGFRHGDSFLARLRHQASLQSGDSDCRDLTERYLVAVLNFDELDETVQAALHALVRPFVRRLFETAARDLALLMSVAKLPTSVWTGNGGYYPGRVVGLEVLRRGGEVRRFDHGGTAALCDMPSFLAVQELAVSTHFVMPTIAAARTGAIQSAGKAVTRKMPVAIEGHTGDPTFDVGAAAWRDRNTVPARRRVLCVSTMYYGFAQTMIPVPPDVVYLDWQMHLIETLCGLPIELVCKPHPEGVLGYTKLPYADKATVSTASFETALSEADVLVMDYAASTTFAIALTTDRPIVFIDLGLFRFNADVAAAIEARCRIVRAELDDRKRPRVDVEVLAEAVCAGDPVADPAFFRGLYLGE